MKTSVQIEHSVSSVIAFSAAAIVRLVAGSLKRKNIRKITNDKLKMCEVVNRKDPFFVIFAAAELFLSVNVVSALIMVSVTLLLQES